MCDALPRWSFLPSEAQEGNEGGAAPADAGLIALVDEARRADASLRSLLAGDARDTAEIPGFEARADASNALVDRVCVERALDLPGLVAKARLAEHLDRYQGDMAARLALSVVRDLLALSAATPT